MSSCRLSRLGIQPTELVKPGFPGRLLTDVVTDDMLDDMARETSTAYRTKKGSVIRGATRDERESRGRAVVIRTMNVSQSTAQTQSHRTG